MWWKLKGYRQSWEDAPVGKHVTRLRLNCIWDDFCRKLLEMWTLNLWDNRGLWVLSRAVWTAGSGCQRHPKHSMVLTQYLIPRLTSCVTGTNPHQSDPLQKSGIVSYSQLNCIIISDGVLHVALWDTQKSLPMKQIMILNNHCFATVTELKFPLKQEGTSANLNFSWRKHVF